MTPIEIGSGVLALLAIGGALLADGRARGRNEIVAERVAKLEGLADRVVTLEANANNGKEALERHYKDDMAALAAINLSLREMRAEVLAAVSELRADLRASREDTSPGRRG